jgi:hypothetical protein
MDLVSFETRAEYEWVKQRLGGVQFFWTSGSPVIRGHRVHCTSGSSRGWAESSSSGHQVVQYSGVTEYTVKEGQGEAGRSPVHLDIR